MEEEIIDLRDDVDSDFRCFDCRVDTALIGEYYIVADEVWGRAGMEVEKWEVISEDPPLARRTILVPGDNGMLCIGCLETRLKRRLTPSDFDDAPVNAEIDDRGNENHHSYRLQNRLGRRFY